MLTRRSHRLRLRQQNAQTASTSAASSSSLSSTNGTSKSMNKPAKKRVRTEPSLDMQAVNQPKQKKMKLSKNNLESFPTEILENIFIKTDDIGLLNLANSCTRLKAIAETVFAKRYADQYFSINDECLGGDPEIYAALFNCFGGSIKAIQLDHIEDIDSTHWAMKIIQPHINRIEKLAFDACDFKSYNVLAQSLTNITHLAFRDAFFGYDDDFDLPDCQNLIELELREAFGFSYNSLRKMIRNNPALQRVIIKDSSPIDYRIINLIADHLKEIKELVLVDEYFENWNVPLLIPAIDKIGNSFKHLESFSINITDDLLEPLQRLAKECKGLKHLGLFDYDIELHGEAIRSFRQTESLYLAWDFNVFALNELPVEHLPNLRHLNIEMAFGFDEYNENKFSNVLPLLKKGKSLQKITMVFKDDYGPIYPGDFITAEFFEKFIETITVIGKSNVRIEVEHKDQIIGNITANGVIWRNKLMFWMDCNKNDTNIRLLDLADHRNKSDKTKNAADQTNFLDKICDYLDLGSLTALAEMNERSERLVNSYVKKQVKKQKTFNITDEFHLPERIVHKLKCAGLITDLNVCILYDKSTRIIAQVIKKCELLEKLSIHDKRSHTFWPKVETNLSQIVYNSTHFTGYSTLIEIVEDFEQAEEIEFKNASLFNDLKSDANNTKKFSSLKKFTFNYRGETQLKNLKKIFENTRVQLVPIYSQNQPSS